MSKLPKELIKDFDNGVMVTDLCKKYGLARHVIREQLMVKKTTHGGRRKGCGRKRKEGSGELQRIREKNAKMSFKKQPEGTLANPRSNLCRKYSNTYYMGGF